MRWLLVTVVAGCGFGATPGGMNPGDDAPPAEAGPDVPGGCVSFSTLYDTCDVPTPGTAAALDVPTAGTNTYDSGSNTLTLDGADTNPLHARFTGPTGDIDVVFVTTLTIPAMARLRIFGPRPVLFVATGGVQIDGTLESIGPGAGSRTDTTCQLTMNDGVAGADGDGGGGGGGGGGAFQGAGGNGGAGDKDSGASEGGRGGVALAQRPAGLVGGCDGGRGGDGGGMAGDGGGAIAIASADVIAIGASGVINVGGGGGRRGGMNNRGGGGGGSGGMIVLEAPSVQVAGVLAANGGGGGEGDTNTATGDGLPGQASATPAAGGDAGDSNGGNGAAGGAGATLAGSPAVDLQNGGGGGAGGGVGYIAIGTAMPMINGTVSPNWQPWP